MADHFAGHASGLDSPATKHQLLSANASADLSPRPRAIYCEAGGTITLRDGSGNDLAYSMSAGSILPLRAVRVTAISGGTFYGLS